MPGSVIVAAVASYAGAAAATAMGFVAGTFAYAASSAVVGFAVSSVGNKLLGGDEDPQPQTASGFTSHAQARTQVVRSAVANRNIIYGRAMVSGPLVFAASTNKNNRLHLVIALAGHEVEDIESVWFNDELVDLTPPAVTNHNTSETTYVDAESPSTTVSKASTFVANVSVYSNTLGKTLTDVSPAAPASDDEYRVVDGVYTFYPQWQSVAITYTYSKTGAPGSRFYNYVTISKHLGGADQTADADLIAANVGWTSAHRLRGVAYLYVRLTYDRDVFPRGIPNIKAIVKGKKVYDPRTATTAWSDNWALCVRDYVASAYGLGAASSELDSASFIAAANVADEDVALAAGGTEKRYTCNGVIDLGSTPRKILEAMLTGGAGVLTWTAGVYKLFAGAYTVPDITLDEDDLRGAVRVRPRTRRQELYNAVRGTYVNPDNNWQPSDYPAVSNSTYASQDGGEVIWRDHTLAFTDSAAMAQRLAKIALERARQGITVEMPCKLTAFKVACWDTVKLNIAHLGWSEKVFRVIEWKWAEIGGIDLVLQEESSAAYDWNSGEETVVDAAPDTSLPDPFTVEVPGVPAVSEALYETRNGAGVKAKATIETAGSEDAFVSQYQFEWSVAGEEDWKLLSRGDATIIDVFDVAPGLYDVRVKAINDIGVSSAWATRRNVEILGLAVAPSGITGLSLQAAGGLAILTWDLSPDLDVRIGGKIRVRHSSALADAVWESSVSIGSAVTGNTTVAVLPLKEGTYLVKAEDSTGNLSGVAAGISTKQASALAWSPLTSVQEDDDFTGAHDGTFVDAGELVLGSGTLFDSMPGSFDDATGSFDFANGVASSGIYDFATGMDLGSVQPVRLTSLLSVSATSVNAMFDATGGLFDSASGLFDGTEGAPVDAYVEVRETDDDPAGTPTWSAWKRLDAAEFNARAFDFRARLTSGDPNFTIKVSQLRVAAANL